MIDELLPVRDAIKYGHKAEARKLLRSLLKSNPSAEAWYLAAQTMDSRKQAIKCLRRALEMDEWHTQSNRMLHELEGAKPAEEIEKEKRRAMRDVQPLAPLAREGKEAPNLRRARKQKGRNQALLGLGCLGGLTMALVGAFFIMNVLGVSLLGDVMCRLGIEECPVYEIEGTPVELLDDAVYRVEPDQVKDAPFGEQIIGTLQPGHSHEYEFDASVGDEVVIMVQFQPTVNGVTRNVGIFDSEGYIAEEVCTREYFFEDDFGTILACTIDKDGRWKVRIFGREGESVGVYLLMLERLALSDYDFGDYDF